MACYAGVVKASTLALLLPFPRMHETSVRQLIESSGPWVGGPAAIALLIKRGLLPSLVRSQYYPGLARDLLACPLVLGLTVEKRMPWQAALVPHAIASLTTQVSSYPLHWKLQLLQDILPIMVCLILICARTFCCCSSLAWPTFTTVSWQHEEVTRMHSNEQHAGPMVPA